MFQKESSKLLENKITYNEKRNVSIKDFNSLLSENNFEDIQLSFMNPFKSEVFLLKPMNEAELTQMELSLEAQNAYLNMSKLTIPNFQTQQNFSPFNLNHPLLNANFTPIMSRATPPPNIQNFINSNANNFFGFNQAGSNFNSPAINFNLFPPNNDYFFSKMMETLNNPHKNFEQSHNLTNFNVNNNNMSYNLSNNNGYKNDINVKMEMDGENSSTLNKRT